MKQIFLAIQDRLAATVPALRHTDKNWGQLTLPQPPVQWPCCLIDLDSVDYSQTASPDSLAQAAITLTLADRHTVRSSAKAPSKADAYDFLDIIEAVSESLEGWRVPNTTQALTRTRLARAYADTSYDVYTLTLSTAWVEQIRQEGETIQFRSSRRRLPYPRLRLLHVPQIFAPSSATYSSFSGAKSMSSTPRRAYSSNAYSSPTVTTASALYPTTATTTHPSTSPSPTSAPSHSSQESSASNNAPTAADGAPLPLC